MSLLDVAVMKLFFTFYISFGRGSSVAIVLSNRTLNDELKFGPVSTALIVLEAPESPSVIQRGLSSYSTV